MNSLVQGMVLILGAMVMLAVAFLSLRSSHNARFREKVSSHFSHALPRGTSMLELLPGTRRTFWQQLQVRGSVYAGFELRESHLITIPAAFLLFGVLGWAWLGWVGALIFFLGALFLVGFVLPYTRLQRRRAQISAQVPVFVDQVLRSLGTGRSVESAIRLATSESAEPLRQVLERVVRATDLGADMAEAMSEVAQLHGLREFSLIALAMRISNNYGSSPKEMLQSVVEMIRQRELAQRELAAMTGETRITAWVLGLTPIALGGYMMMANPGYMDLMLQTPSGKTILGVALGLQGTGVLILWRMLKSV